MRFLGIMTTRGEEAFARGTQVIARTDRGLECSIVLCEATDESTKELKNPTQGQILRHDDGRFNGAFKALGTAAR